MSEDVVVLKLAEREIIGKGLGQMRIGGQVPAVIHDHGKLSTHVSGNLVDFQKAYKSAGKNHPVTLNVGEKKFTALIKDVYFKPPKHQLQHIVFQAVSKNEKVEAEVPIVYIGTAPAERLGLIVLHQLDHVVVEATATNLPDHFEVDSEKLAELHDKITVADLVVPEGVKLITELDHGIATVVEPRAVAAAEESEDESSEQAKEESEEE